MYYCNCSHLLEYKITYLTFKIIQIFLKFSTAILHSSPAFIRYSRLILVDFPVACHFGSLVKATTTNKQVQFDVIIKNKCFQQISQDSYQKQIKVIFTKLEIRKPIYRFDPAVLPCEDQLTSGFMEHSFVSRKKY